MSKEFFTPSKLAEGKTKIIWETSDTHLVRIESKDDITTLDGEKRDFIEGKAKLATMTTVNVFKLLERKGIETHFVEQDSPTSFIAKKLQMIPLESVARRKAAGSYLLRNPEVGEGYRFEKPVTELFFKDDSLHDPILFYGDRQFLLYDAKKPTTSSLPIKKLSLSDVNFLHHEVGLIKVMTEDIFIPLEKEFLKIGIDLVDMKVEFGKFRDRLMLGDVIDNDSWRLWPHGDKSLQLDKQGYREGNNLVNVLKNYTTVANLTNSFT